MLTLDDLARISLALLVCMAALYFLTMRGLR
jgi:hypothetical protein